MKVETTYIPGLILIEPKVWGDTRGYFLETFKESSYQELGLKEAFVQDNLSSSAKGTLRGLHYQLKHPQGKLVSVVQGQVLDVIVDIRTGSPTFGQALSILLDAERHNQVYAPPGVAHGFCVLSESAIFSYKCTDLYHPEDEYGVAWDDPELNIDWQLDGTPKLSDKDAQHRRLADIPSSLLPIFVD